MGLVYPPGNTGHRAARTRQRTAHTLPKWLADTGQVFRYLGEPTPAIGLTALLVTVTAELRRRSCGLPIRWRFWAIPPSVI